MKFTAEQSALTAALDHIRAIVSKRNTIPVLGNTLVTATADGLTMTATDLDIEVTETVAADILSTGAVTVPAHILSDIVRKLPKGSQVGFETADNSARVTAGRSRFELATLPREDFPVMTMAVARSQAVFTMAVSELRDLIGRTIPTVSTEETRFHLNGIYLHNSDGQLRAVSTDGHRLTRYDTSLPVGAEQIPGIILPRTTCTVLAGLLRGGDGDIEITVCDTKIRTTFGGITLVSKLIDGTFPDYTRVIPKEPPNHIRTDVKALSAAVDRAGVIFDGPAAVKFTLNGDGVTLTAQSSANSAGSVEELEAEYSGAALEIGFNHKYLAGILGGITGDQVDIAMGDSGSPSVITDPAEQGVLYVLMPMRV